MWCCSLSSQFRFVHSVNYLTLSGRGYLSNKDWSWMGNDLLCMWDSGNEKVDMDINNYCNHAHSLPDISLSLPYYLHSDNHSK